MGALETIGTIAGGGGILSVIGAWFFGKRKAKTDMLKTEVEALQQVVGIWKQLAIDMKIEVAELKIEVSRLSEENKILSKEVHRLTNMINGRH